MRSRLISITNALHTVRPVIVPALAVAVVAAVLASKGSGPLSLVLSVFLLLLAATAMLQVHRDVSRLRRRSSDLHKMSVQAEQHYIVVLKHVIGYLDARNAETRGRGERVGNLAQAIAVKMGLPRDRCELLNLAGQLHDIGMIAVSERILAKRSALAGGEFGQVKKHCEVSVQLLAPLESLSEVMPAILHHHERMNGTGYPHGLAGESIPLEARILAVADSYDAMTHDRPHRTAISPAEAVLELHRCSPAGYDVRCVEAISQVLKLDALMKGGGRIEVEFNEEADLAIPVSVGG